MDSVRRGSDAMEGEGEGEGELFVVILL